VPGTSHQPASHAESRESLLQYGDSKLTAAATKLHIAATRTSPKRASSTSNLQKTCRPEQNKTANLAGIHAAPTIKPQPKQ